MDPDPFRRWPDLDARFARALALPPAERDAFLDAVGAEDPALRRELERLLAADADASTFLETPAARVSAPRPGERVGPYRLVEAVGRGGMGTVFRAERADGAFSQTVAVKLLHPGPVAEEVRRRFEAERQILARLEHAHIARLLDGGLTEAGLPWLAMEFVEGMPITDHCDARRLGVEARLLLFLDVCAAVTYAHRNLIVHRDLKPSNVFVTDDAEGAPQVKLLDFGIAKLLNETARPPLTRSGLRPMTPEYAAPEQVRGEPVTTATDVYQLGVLLYELLTGRRPYRIPTRLLHEVARIICEEPPER
ncbi:MAG: serine/threonine protein kinase, partial [Rhodothermaceae bacterium]|nr:serine/threonine protein kinase [Rhodothermaceae bacterium]